MATSALPDGMPGGRKRARPGEGYFFWSSVLLLAFVLVGFAPTLFLRAWFGVEPIPAFLYLHGAVLTSWFAWLVVQASLVRTGNSATHRRTRWAGAAIGAAVCLAGPMASVGVVHRLRAASLDWDTDMNALPFLGVTGVKMIDFVTNVVIGNLFSIVEFAVLLSVAIWLRKSPHWHNRLVLLASFAIIGPALARISRWPVIGGEDTPFVLIVLVALLATLAANDLATRRRVHRATVTGLAFLVIMSLLQGPSKIPRSPMISSARLDNPMRA